jgi:hypothetical protein
MNQKFLPIVDNKDLIRDTNSKAILVTNHSKLEEHRKKKKLMEDLISQGDQINIINNEIAEIKAMLQQLISINNK